MLASRKFFNHAIHMSELSETPKQLDYRSRLPYPEAVQDESQEVVILNLHEPFRTNVIKNMFAQIQDHSPDGVITAERSEKSKRFWTGINAGLVAVGNVTQFERVSLIDLPSDFYDVVVEPTRFSWARLKAWEMPAEEAITAFGLTQDQAGDSEIVIVPPYRNPLEPYARAVEDLYGKTPSFMQYTEIYYGGGFPWKISEYRPGLRNFIGEVSGAL